MIGAAGELDCFSAHILLREPGKSEDKVEHDHKSYDLTPAIRQPPAFQAASLMVFLRRSPDVFLASFPIPSTNLLAKSLQAPTASSNPWPNN
ncbi:hypothetical protein B296_00044953 [Ensete ventricosum]|uniref:Uncharacterized protein n=1 Tax=Ensete ventricosum TaxID=4639 RepID=A0A426Y353_ENSVE|nr:hypothetical protein B296_00044953 [Ensete ventricosum]